MGYISSTFNSGACWEKLFSHPNKRLSPEGSRRVLWILYPLGPLASTAGVRAGTAHRSQKPRKFMFL